MGFKKVMLPAVAATMIASQLYGCTSVSEKVASDKTQVTTQAEPVGEPVQEPAGEPVQEPAGEPVQAPAKADSTDPDPAVIAGEQVTYTKTGDEKTVETAADSGKETSGTEKASKSKKKSKKKPDYKVKKVKMTMYATEKVNVREKPTTEGKKIGTKGYGEEVKVTGKVTKYKGEKCLWYETKGGGFISGAYLSKTKPAPVTSDTTGSSNSASSGGKGTSSNTSSSSSNNNTSSSNSTSSKNNASNSNKDNGGSSSTSNKNNTSSSSSSSKNNSSNGSKNNSSSSSDDDIFGDFSDVEISTEDFSIDDVDFDSDAYIE